MTSILPRWGNFFLFMKLFFLTVLFLLTSSAGQTAAAGAEGELLAVITVESREMDYTDAIVQVKLPGHVNVHRPLRMLARDSGIQIPVQVETYQQDRILWFIIDGVLPAGSVRTYELSYGVPLQAGHLSLNVDDRGVRFYKGNRFMFRYNHAYVPPPPHADPLFIRSGYIHPVHSPSGLLVTEDFPRHLHHKGVWLPWTSTRFEGRDIDFWNLGKGDATVQFAGFESMDTGPVFAGLRIRHEFLDLTQPNGGKTVLNETWNLRAWNTDESYFLWDLFSLQRMASDSPLELLEYHYGGLGFRGAREWVDENHLVLTSEGHTKADGNAERSRWVAHSGIIAGGRKATVVIMVHPQNERFPEPMRMWDSGAAFFCYTPPQLGDWTLEPGRDYRFHYRFFIHDGPIDAQKAEQMWQQFARPILVRAQFR